MKKIIYIFGEAGTGKKTLIENILINKENIREQLGIETDKITVVRDTIEIFNSGRFEEENEIEKRNRSILKGISKFIQDENEILLIKGNIRDLEEHYKSIIKTIENESKEVEKEIYFLEVKDQEQLYERIINEDWFVKELNKNIYRYPKPWLDISTRHIKNRTYELAEELGYKITEIDTTDGYTVKKEDYTNKTR